MTQKKLVVSPETARMIQIGHPWVIADAYTKRWNPIKSGETALLSDTNGNVLATALLSPNERIVARVLENRPVTIDRAWLANRMKTADSLRRNHAGIDAKTNAYRLINGEGDGLSGLTVDRYGDYLMIQLYADAWRPFLPLITELLNQNFKPAGIYEKSRPQNTRELGVSSDSKRYGTLLCGRKAPEKLQVLENGLNFLVSLEYGLNSGLFLDQRANRLDLMNRVSGKRFLNLFSYTGAFSVAAAASGAKEVTSVDASPGYSEWAKQNFSINRLKIAQHPFIVGDCLTVLAELTKTNKRYDIILMDPPSFSTTSKNRFTTRGGTNELVTATVQLLVEGGLLITSSNHQKVDIGEYVKEIRRGALKAGCELQVVSLTGQGSDFPYPVTFPEGRYLKYVVMVKTQH